MRANPVIRQVVYRPESAISDPAALFRGMVKDLRESGYIAWRIFFRDINARYRQTLLGFFWAFVPPIVVALGFTWAGKAKVINVGETALPYPAYVMLSMVLWQVFAEAVAGPVQAVTETKAMLARINFPREAIVLAKVFEVLFACAIKAVLVIALFVWFEISVSSSLIFVPLAIAMLIALGTAIGVALAPVAALYQDFSKGLTVLLGMWLFLTPVVYPLPSGEGSLATLVRMNPVTPLLVTARDLATGYSPTLLSEFLIISAATLVVLVMTWVAYRLAMPYVIERLSS
jgi:lipopolysaccharide transport system permease protein